MAAARSRTGTIPVGAAAVLSPYEDHTPLAQAGVPEVREYAARAVVGDEEIGQLSDIVVATYAG